MLRNRITRKNKTRQRGASTVEFGIIAMLFFMLFFGIIEFGRFFYLYNTVQEVTRCAARQAVVSWMGKNGDWIDASIGGTSIPSIRQQCLFNHNELVAGWEITEANIRLRALNLGGTLASPADSQTNLANCIADPAGSDCIRYVEASVVQVTCNGNNCQPSCDKNGNNCQPIQYQPMFGLIPLRVGIPNSTVTMPAESLGYTM